MFNQLITTLPYDVMSCIKVIQITRTNHNGGFKHEKITKIHKPRYRYRNTAVGFPSGHSAFGYIQGMSQIGLGHAFLFSKLLNTFTHCHMNHLTARVTLKSLFVNSKSALYFIKFTDIIFIYTKRY